MLACSVETISRNAGRRSALRHPTLGRALMWWPRASKPTGFSKWVSLSQSLSISRLISPRRPRRQGARPRRRCRRLRRSGSSSIASGHLNCPPPRGRRCCRRRSKVAPVRETATSSSRLPLFRVIRAAMIFVAEAIGASPRRLLRQKLAASQVRQGPRSAANSNSSTSRASFSFAHTAPKSPCRAGTNAAASTRTNARVSFRTRAKRSLAVRVSVAFRTGQYRGCDGSRPATR